MLPRQLEGLRVDLEKFSNLPFDFEIRFNGVLRHEEHEYLNKNVRCTLQGPRVDVSKIQICP